jgi:hypothetical protein
MEIHDDVIKHYDDILLEYTGKCESTEASGTMTEAKHLRYMLKMISDKLVTNEKAHRWLGFIQGIVIANGWSDVNSERNFTRKYLTPEDGIYYQIPRGWHIGQFLNYIGKPTLNLTDFYNSVNNYKFKNIRADAIYHSVVFLPKCKLYKPLQNSIIVKEFQSFVYLIEHCYGTRFNDEDMIIALKQIMAHNKVSPSATIASLYSVNLRLPEIIL